MDSLEYHSLQTRVDNTEGSRATVCIHPEVFDKQVCERKSMERETSGCWYLLGLENTFARQEKSCSIINIEKDDKTYFKELRRDTRLPLQE